MTPNPNELSNEDLRVSASDDEHVLYATIDRPEAQNATNERVNRGLLEVLDAADRGPTRVVVIRGAEGTFCSGGDLGGMDDEADDDGEMRPLTKREHANQLSALLDTLTATSALTVAAVEGYCLAGGCGLAAACEFVIAEEGATFGTPEVNVGLFPMQASAPIMRAVGQKKGLELMFTGEFLSAEEAADIGLVTRVYPDTEFEDQLEEFVSTLASNSPVMIELGKEAYYRQRDMSYDDAHTYLKEMLTLLMTSEDHKEGVAAFQEDREPEWVGR